MTKLETNECNCKCHSYYQQPLLHGSLPQVPHKNPISLILSPFAPKVLLNLLSFDDAAVTDSDPAVTDSDPAVTDSNPAKFRVTFTVCPSTEFWPIFATPTSGLLFLRRAVTDSDPA